MGVTVSQPAVAWLPTGDCCRVSCGKKVGLTLSVSVKTSRLNGSGGTSVVGEKVWRPGKFAPVGEVRDKVGGSPEHEEIVVAANVLPNESKPGDRSAKRGIGGAAALVPIGAKLPVTVIVPGVGLVGIVPPEV